MTVAPDNPIEGGPQPGSVSPHRHLFGATLTLVALVTMLAVGLVYVGVPANLIKLRQDREWLTRTVPVVVAAREIPSGQRIFPDMVKTSTIRATLLPSHAFSKPSDVWLFRAAVPIHQNEIITNALLAGVMSCWSCAAPLDIVAMTLPIRVLDRARSIAAGDYVNLIATVNTASFSAVHPRWVSLPVFSNVAVIRIGPPPRLGAQSMTVVVSPCDAEFIEWFLINAHMRFTAGYSNYSAEIAPAGSSCGSATGLIGPTQVDARWGFSTANPPRPGGIA